MKDTDQLKTNKLNVYLIKEDYTDLDTIVQSTQIPIEIKNIGHFYYEPSFPKKPTWVENFFGDELNLDKQLLTASAQGLLIVKLDDINRAFAIAFGSGRFLLNDGVIEERFGLKVVLNSVDPISFRSIQKTTLGPISKNSQEQMSKEVAPSDFGIDIEQDLITSITGKSNDLTLGGRVSGKDALSLSVKADISNIKELLQHCLTRYESKDYRQNFDWIDQISEIRDKVLEETLWKNVIEKIKLKDFDKIWMAVPEIIDWSDLKGFRYIREIKEDLFEDLSMIKYVEIRGSDNISVERIHQDSIFMISSSSDTTIQKWSVSKCIYAEEKHNSETYILNNGKWYLISTDFVSEVENDFNSIEEASISLPDCVDNNESDYNKKAAANISNAACLDANLINYGGGKSKIEFCDIFTTDNKIIHVKKYGNSSVLSHLFSQGVVSGELFVSDAKFRKLLNAKLPKTHKIVRPETRPKPEDYEIIFGIISGSKNPLNLPFFSKVTIRNARRRLKSFGYKDIYLSKIQKN